VKVWLTSHPRFKLHFTPTSASWLNLVERFFAEITSRRIRRGSYTSVDDLEAVIYDYLAQHNEKPKPFHWSKTAEDTIACIAKSRLLSARWPATYPSRLQRLPTMKPGEFLTTTNEI